MHKNKGFSLAAACTLLAALLTTGCSGPELPEPAGPYTVGTTVFSLTDDQREESYTSEKDDMRSIVVRAWYPAEVKSPNRYEETLYMTEGHVEALNEIMGFPKFMIRGESPAPVFTDAPGANGAFPVLIFNHGYLSYAEQSTVLLTELASHGYTIFSVSHPYESAYSLFPDGHGIQAAELPYIEIMKHSARDPELYTKELLPILEKMKKAETFEDFSAVAYELAEAPTHTPLIPSVDLWIGDTRLLISNLEKINRGEGPEQLEGMILSGSIGLLGHSFGGIISSLMALEDIPGMRCVVNLDGPVFFPPEKSYKISPIPQLCIHSTDTGTRKFTADYSGINDALLESSGPGSSCLSIRGSAHQNFSDLTYIPILKKMNIIGPGDGNRIGAITAEAVRSFFDSRLKGIPASFLPDDYPEVTVTAEVP